MSEILIETKHLSKNFGSPLALWGRRKMVSAVSDVSLFIEKGGSLGLAGESGSGKSTLGRMVSGLEKPTAGQVLFRNNPISSLSLKAMQPFRRSIQMIFQNSAGVFDPAYTIGESIAEVVRNNERVAVGELRERVDEILNQVGLSGAYALRFSRELSGGQRQRANIARALVLHPEFIVCDEPVSSLDYPLRKQILSLLNRLRESLGLTYMFITHDLDCVPYVCDRLVILYAGYVVEILDLTRNNMQDAVHYYTRLLLDSIPASHPKNRRERSQEEKIAEDLVLDGGQACCFCTRCKAATEKCRNTIPRLHEIEPGHLVACHYF